MQDLNSVFVIGRLTRDPELFYTQSGTAGATFSVANSDDYGEKKHTNFFDVIVWGKQAGAVTEYLKKGHQVAIEGKLKHETWDDQQTGQKRHKTVINANRVQFLQKPQNQGNQQGGFNGGFMPQQNNIPSSQNNPWN